MSCRFPEKSRWSILRLSLMQKSNQKCSGCLVIDFYYFIAKFFAVVKWNAETKSFYTDQTETVSNASKSKFDKYLNIWGVNHRNFQDTFSLQHEANYFKIWLPSTLYSYMLPTHLISTYDAFSRIPPQLEVHKSLSIRNNGAEHLL